MKNKITHFLVNPLEIGYFVNLITYEQIDGELDKSEFKNIPL